MGILKTYLLFDALRVDTLTGDLPKEPTGLAALLFPNPLTPLDPIALTALASGCLAVSVAPPPSPPLAVLAAPTAAPPVIPPRLANSFMRAILAACSCAQLGIPRVRVMMMVRVRVRA